MKKKHPMSIEKTKDDTREYRALLIKSSVIFLRRSISVYMSYSGWCVIHIIDGCAFAVYSRNWGQIPIQAERGSERKWWRKKDLNAITILDSASFSSPAVILLVVGAKWIFGYFVRQKRGRQPAGKTFVFGALICVKYTVARCPRCAKFQRKVFKREQAERNREEKSHKR